MHTDILAPQEIKNLLQKFVESFQKLLGDNLTGVYLHGSLAMGCYNPNSSDIDILIVVQEKLTVPEKRQSAELMLELSRDTEKSSFEMNIVTSGVLHNFEYPTPFEFHFSDSLKNDYKSGNFDFSIEKTDPDLAAHFVITRTRGMCLYGEPIEKVFPDVPKQYYFDSIAKDSEWSFHNIEKGPDKGECKVPVYAVLNFCRVLALIQSGLITSKREGGEWGLKNIPHEFSPVIVESVKEYEKSGTGNMVDCKLLKQFAQYAYEQIHKN
ncbi:DUF4111 domain-containing protein [Candidatus Roizmanbacteria bacterium]|nr:DUF4111 domain-containing protein [Candidatus Roizmanbacteria bacterium]